MQRALFLVIYRTSTESDLRVQVKYCTLTHANPIADHLHDSMPSIDDSLRRVFGLHEFRPGQRAIVDGLIAGRIHPSGCDVLLLRLTLVSDEALGHCFDVPLGPVRERIVRIASLFESMGAETAR